MMNKIFGPVRIAILILALFVTLKECSTGNFRGPWERGWLVRAFATPKPTARPTVNWCALQGLPKVGETVKATQAAVNENRKLMLGEKLTVSRVSEDCRQFQARRENGQIIWFETGWWIKPLELR